MTLIISLFMLAHFSGATVFGKGSFSSPPANLEQMLAKPADFEGKKFVVEGKVREVCQRLGCWLKIESGGSQMRIATKDHAFFVPKGLKGKVVKAEGILTRNEDKLEFVADAISDVVTKNR